MIDMPIRDAATIIVIRDRATAPSVLMGQRGASAAFMPRKFVFPGGAVDPVDHAVSLSAPLHPTCVARGQDASDISARTLAATAIRELWEETGLVLGTPGEWTDAPKGWRSFAATGHRPSGAALTFVFRALTPPGQPRRFDARFFLADAEAIASDLDDFAAAEDELSHLGWVPLADVRALDLPFITQVVLAEIAANLTHTGPPAQVPFVRNEDESNMILSLDGRHPMDRLPSQNQ